MCEKTIKHLNAIEMGRRIRSQREFMNMSREVLADKLAVSAKFIADIEYGEKGVSIKRLYILSQVLGVTSDYILAGKEEDADHEEKNNIMADIMEPLKNCSTQQLKCMENITRYYVEALKES